MQNVDGKPIFARFETPEQRRIRETKLQQWWLERILEDRADADIIPPLELLEPGGHG